MLPFWGDLSDEAVNYWIESLVTKAFRHHVAAFPSFFVTRHLPLTSSVLLPQCRQHRFGRSAEGGVASAEEAAQLVERLMSWGFNAFAFPHGIKCQSR